MSAHAVVWLLIVVALVVVLAMSGAQVARAVREMKRLGDRVDAFADLPVMKKLDRMDADMARIAAAVAQLTPLIERVNAALKRIRQGPFPPEFFDAIRRLRAQFADFRSFARR
jgi:hypothetical protein